MTANILIIDDVDTNVRLLEAKLLKEYYTVFTANSAQNGFKIIESAKIDLILLDVMMPNIDGIEMCKILKSNKKFLHIPVIMITALSDTQDKIKGLEAGADEFLTKPINDIPLFARVRSLTRTKSLMDELMIRNQTKEDLGLDGVEIIQNFTKSNILFITEDYTQTNSVIKAINFLSPNIKITDNIQDLVIPQDDYLPDLIIISSQLEKLDPLRIVAFLKNADRYKNTIIMMLAEEENDPKIIKSMDIGANDYFLYPVDENELIARVKTQLRRKFYLDGLKNFLDQTINFSVSDGLTNIFNRRYFDIYLKEMIKKTNKDKMTLWLIIFDIDNFKKINDSYGHQEGDRLLIDFAKILKDSIRVTDLAARYGGEEFIILLKDMNKDMVNEIAENIRHSLQNHFITTQDDLRFNSTVSGGMTSYIIGENINSFINRADKALYQAKHLGGNRLLLY